ncbi:hypothetical protein DPEC_G00044030 [Dallia pectoralis]|uniref:Uncharacterized protein n=1 Tax=Dallia pectoralis TaxID=75939 RepID=A0ACC2H9U3_DALPE|nr:hypothetical protein DPEC_G00044030 [Dallia pectoralis]
MEDPRPHVLLLDGHYSHVFNLEFLELMKKNNICVVSNPPHTTHALQPADRSLFRSLKHHCQELGRKWTRKKGFRASGMFPVSMEVIPTGLFFPSQTTEMVIEIETLLLSEKDIYFGVEEVVVTSQPEEDAHTSPLTTGPAPMPPSYHLTSQEHVQAKAEKKKSKTTTKVRKPAGVRPQKAAVPPLQTVHGSDPCTGCKESCGELNGLMDDDDFISLGCVH